MCNGIVPEGKGMIWKAAVAAIKAQGGTVGFDAHGPEHEERPDRHRGQARGGRGAAASPAWKWPRPCATAARSG